MTDPALKIETYLIRRIGDIRAMKGPQDGSFQKSTFMLEVSTFAEAGFITHDERFAWVERMLRETAPGFRAG